MKLSQKGEYGLLALLELARRYGQGPQQAGAVAAAREIPAQYLPQILASLRRADLVHSERGPKGGHQLARPPAQIALLAAVAALEGATSPVPCADAERTPVCMRQGTCVLREVWQRVDAATREILSQITLADLVRREMELQVTPMYFI